MSIESVSFAAGYVPLGRSLFGSLMELNGTTLIPFVIGTEFPDMDYSPIPIPSSTGEDLEPNLLFLGMIDLESRQCSLVFDIETPYTKTTNEEVSDGCAELQLTVVVIIKQQMV